MGSLTGSRSTRANRVTGARTIHLRKGGPRTFAAQSREDVRLRRERAQPSRTNRYGRLLGEGT